MTAPTAAELGDYLEQLARTGKVVAYSDLSDHFRLPKKMAWKDNPLYPLLGDVTQLDIRAGRPLRISLVVSKIKEKKTIPSDGYFTIVANYRHEQIPDAKAEKKRIHDRELKTTLTYYGFQGEPNRE
jgi:hypothetical protein